MDSAHPKPESLNEAVAASSLNPVTPENRAKIEGLTEDQVLAQLEQPDLAPEDLEKVGKQNALLKSRKVSLAIVRHCRTPRHVSLAIVRRLLTFDLMRVALEPVVPGDIKIAAEEALIRRLETVTSGEKLALARRASGRVAAALLSDPEERVMRLALDNARLTESLLLHALSGDASSRLVQAVCQHSKWSLREDVRMALLRNQHTAMEQALDLGRHVSVSRLEEILQHSGLPEATKAILLKRD